MNTKKKNQHYIPKFYLRNFSFEKNEKQIGVYNQKSSFFYAKAKLKTQGSKNFFYGHDGVVEDVLANIEGITASILNRIIETKKLPKRESIDHLNLLTFIAITDLRNPITIDNIKGFTDHMKIQLKTLDPNFNDERIPNISHEWAIELALSNFKEVIKNIVDLQYKLLINETDIPFICSDFPIIKYNIYLEKAKWPGGKLGYGIVGLKIIFPITPKLGLIFYDSSIYKVGFRRQDSLILSENRDIDSLNLLQVLNSYDNLFFNEGVKEHYVRELIQKASKFKRANQMKSELSYLLEAGENPIDLKSRKENLIVFGNIDSGINLEIRGIKIHSKGKGHKLENSAPLRQMPRIIREQRG